MSHLILLGDSIFDNAPYVPDGLPVIEQLQQLLTERGDRATLLAVDGDYIEDVALQVQQLPSDATHLFLSVGGNDALRYGLVLQNSSATDALQALATMKTEFTQHYAEMLMLLLTLDLPITVCTIYDQCPLLDPALRLLAFTALPIFNDCITQQAVEMGLPVIDLRVLCNSPQDYSPLSPIEPSATGGEKIARCIATVAQQHDFTAVRTVLYH